MQGQTRRGSDRMTERSTQAPKHSYGEAAVCFQKLSLLSARSDRDGRIDGDHNQGVIALLAEDLDRITELRASLQAARNHKARLIDLYREHVISHGC